MEEQKNHEELISEAIEMLTRIYEAGYFRGLNQGRQVGFDEAKEMFNVNNDTYEG